MRNLFRGYYTPTEEELADIWSRGLIVLDTNALLNLFRYTDSTRDDFLLVLQALAEQLWIPHQVGLEFQRRRLGVIEDQAKAYDEIDNAIKAASNGILKALQGYRLHPSLDKGATTELLDNSMKAITDAVEKSREDYEARVADGANERVFDTVTTLYEGRVGESTDVETLKALYVEGAQRYAEKIPPGYEDKDKPEPNRYGDLVLWRQLIAHVGNVKQPALFITDDGKEDWWYRVKGKTQGPRVELVDEFFEASGERVHFYSPDQFLRFAKTRLELTVNTTSVREVELVSRERAESERALLLYQLDMLNRDRSELVHKPPVLDFAPMEAEYLSERVAAEKRLMRLREIEERLEAELAHTSAPNEKEDLRRRLHDLKLERRMVRDQFERHGDNLHRWQNEERPLVERDSARLRHQRIRDLEIEIAELQQALSALDKSTRS
ncbi:PIN-like domain-containing protein [Herbiconiux sp. YIM B11900]|uniref:PIN-like domain-containing protein n=1 Tax=Herbiconiux sp. YIM B11900 TaxID=3404131 RepID=UPI003F87EE47